MLQQQEQADRNINPYEGIYAVTECSSFYGREQLLKDILKKILSSDSPSSQQVVGLSRSGKSSLLNIIASINKVSSDHLNETLGLHDLLHRLKPFLFEKIDFSGLSNSEQPEFWRYFSTRLNKIVSANYAASYHMRSISAQFFQADADIERTKELLEILIEPQKSEKYLVLLFDDFDYVMIKYPHVLHNLRYFLEQYKGKLIYITATRRELGSYYEDFPPNSMHISPLFHSFGRPFYLGLLEEKGGKQSYLAFISSLSYHHGVHFKEEDVTNVKKLSGGHPALTKLVCKYVFDAYIYHDGEPIDYERIDEKVYADIEMLMRTIYNQELTDSQRKALLILCCASTSLDLSTKVLEELQLLGLIIKTSSKSYGYQIFSPLLSRYLQSFGRPLSSNFLKLWPERRAIQIGGKIEVLTPNEWKIFYYLYQHPDVVCKRALLLNEIVDEAPLSLSALEITISRLRQKIEDVPERPRIITTIRSQGYRFNMQELAKQTLQQGQGSALLPSHAPFEHSGASERRLKNLQRTVEVLGEVIAGTLTEKDITEKTPDFLQIVNMIETLYQQVSSHIQENTF